MSHPVVHFEIGCRNSEETQKFYKNLFSWEMQPYGPSALISPEGNGIGGHIASLGHEPHNYVTFYVQVDDLQEYLDKAAKLGGKTIVPPTPVPGLGHFAWFADLEGTVIGLWKPQLG